MQGGNPREQELEVVVQLGHRAHGRTRGAYWVSLVNSNSGRHTVDTVNLGFVHAVEKLSGIGGECFDVAALPFGVKGIEN